jgi:asparagine synthase (glutamine-hydrolysing)
MSRTIAYRGPDDSGSYHDPDNGIGLAHRRLSIIDLSAQGRQPMWDAGRSVAIVYNGEIFNYRELRAELEREGWPFLTRTDTEVLLNLYLRDGERMLARLNGMYAFAIWDTRDRSLFVVRDGVGVKPLYFAEGARGFLFASELKALLQEPSLDRTLSPEAVRSYMTYLWCPAPGTMLRAVRKLEPGHFLRVSAGRIVRRQRFYELPYDQEIEPLSEVEAADQVHRHLEQAVRRQMVADVPVGAFLSGGLDSSSVVTFARRYAREGRLQCFTIGFKDASFRAEGLADDLPFAERVARHLGVDLHTVHVGSEMIDQLETMIYHLDEPQADPAPLNALFISRLARENGIKVLLSGAGGDDIFTGYRRHYALQQQRYLSMLPSFVRRAVAAAARRLPASTAPGRRLSKVLRYAGLDGDERIASYFYWIDPALRRTLYGPGLRDALSREAPEPLLVSLQAVPAGVAPLNRMLFLEGKHFLADHNLIYTDKMSMAASVEVRVPLLDPDLIALAARLPLALKQRGRVGKWIFKKAMERELPREVIHRPKTGFGAPLRYWFRHQLRETVREMLSESTLSQRGLFDPAGVRALYEADQAGRVDGTYPLFALMCIELWCRIFVDPATPVAPGRVTP